MKYPVINNLRHCENGTFFLLAGPCVVEDEESPLRIAEQLMALTDRLGVPFLFKASYRKANRTRVDSFQGIGDEKALRVLENVKRQFGVPVVTDIHEAADAALAAEVADVLQIPAFLCRQTSLLEAAGRTGRCVNIKKGQFLSPSAMRFCMEKVRNVGNDNVMLTERGTMFGYGDLVVDFRGVAEMGAMGAPVVVDITHSLQRPNQDSGVSGGRPEMIATIGRAAVAVGCDGLFLETHPHPEKALSDGANMLRLDLVEPLLQKLLPIFEAANR